MSFVHIFLSTCFGKWGSTTEKSNCEKLLETYMDSNFAFGYHANIICCKAS